MGTVVEATVATDQFVLRETTTALDDVQFRLERVVAQSSDRIRPLVWASGSTRSVLEAEFGDDPTIESYELVTDLGDRWLYQLEWSEQIETLVTTIVAEDVVLLEAKNTGDIWELKFLFVERKAIRSVHNQFADRQIDFDVHRIYDQREGQLGTHSLTPKQRRALAAALASGYYGIPRETDASALAAELGISHQALSELLRRAHEAVVSSRLVTEAEPDDD